MDNPEVQINAILNTLQERAKELNCLYQIEEVLNDSNADLETVLDNVLRAIPSGWQYPEQCQAKISLEGNHYILPGYVETPWVQVAEIKVNSQAVGEIRVSYKTKMPKAYEGPFLKEETKLINTIADRLGLFILHQQMKQIVTHLETVKESPVSKRLSEWRIIVDLVRRTDKDLFLRISRKMMNYLSWNGVREAEQILQQLSSDIRADSEELSGGGNRPVQRKNIDNLMNLSRQIFEVANHHIPDEEILDCVQRWMQEDKSSYMIRTVINLESSLGDIADAIQRFTHQAQHNQQLAASVHKGIRVSLVRRFLSDQLEFIKIAKDYVEIDDFAELIPRMIYPQGSHGKLGGKGAGLFIASLILRKREKELPVLKDIRIPKTWYITSDGMHNFMSLNNLEEVIEQKYKEIGQVRQEYPHIIQVFKNSRFTPEMVKGLSMALDDFGVAPLIVRSSSLLEDRLGSAFSGKYLSLFLANQGTKQERLESLMDAIAEVYSSTFGADPIEYRADRDLLDFHEQMGVLIQEVVGSHVGKYFLPTFAGVAFSNNEFRWSSRIKREDGLIRLVPGLGTRAVDRLSDDYPTLVAPGHPGLRVNVSIDETIRYSPNKLDVINLETNRFETVELKEFLSAHGHELPGVEHLVSVIRDSTIQKINLFNTDFEKDDLVVTFEGLIENTSFINQMGAILKTLQTALNSPVDIEFASDGKHFYLLQCRPQSYSQEVTPQPIPKDIPEKAILFTANRYISNGKIPDITHVVYVDPQRYGELEQRDQLLAVGRAVGKLNLLLPKHQFILMGPGRWGSRGDIKLGVNVSYADISFTAMLIEIARKKGNYLPDLSFGTHFFQDLVESGIRYLPLYPDDEGILFNEEFLLTSRNILAEVLPEYAALADVLRVIDVPEVTGGKVLQVFMNADLDEAVGVLSQPGGIQETPAPQTKRPGVKYSDDHWRWRLRMAERIASQLDPQRYGVKAFYVFGSTKNGAAGPGSDIDLLLHFNGSEEQKERLLEWLDGWGKCLSEMNYLRTGYRTDCLLDVHLVTDEDIAHRSSYAVKIGAVTDAAREIPLSHQESSKTD